MMKFITSAISRWTLTICLILTLTVAVELFQPSPKQIKSYSDSNSSTPIQLVSSGISLDTISCQSSTSCLVGGSNGEGQGIIQASAGGSFSADTLPASTGQIDNISCANQFCLASDLDATSMQSGLISSPNGGRNWFIDSTGPSQILKYQGISCATASICFANATTIYSNPVSFWTNNGGTSWNSLSIPAGIFQFGAISCDATICQAIAIGTSPEIITTVTSNPNWQIVSPQPNSIGSLVSISCFDGSTCLVGGTNSNAIPALWSDAFLGLYGSPTTLTTFETAPDVSCMVGNTVNPCVIVGQGTAKLPAIEVGSGTSFSPVSLASSYTQTTGLLDGISCFQDFCTAIGSDTNGNGLAFVSTNLTSWEEEVVGNSVGPISKIYCLDANTCFGISSGADPYSTIQLSQDSGYSWSQAFTSPLYEVNDVTCASSSLCFATLVSNTQSASILSSANGGSSWSAFPLPSNVSATEGISCLSSTTCLIIGKTSNLAAAIFETTDAGAIWTTVGVPSQVGTLDSIDCVMGSTFCGVIFTDTTNSPGVIYTNDSGATFTLGTLGANLMTAVSIYCLSQTNCLIAGGSMSGNPDVEYSTNGGSTWAESTFPASNVALSSISCTTTGICYAVGTSPYGGLGNIFSSTDFGLTWQSASIPGGNYPLKDISCTSFCIAVGGLDAEITIANLFQPTISGISPSSGSTSGNTPVTLIGTDLENVSQVTFGSNPGYDLIHVNSTTLTLFTPPNSSSGSVTVSAISPSGTATSSFNYQSPTIPGGSYYFPTSPTRIVDTRAGATDPSTYAGATLGPNSTLNVNVVGSNGDGVPSGASAVVLNVTVTNPTTAGYLTVYPQGVNKPTASNLNFVAGETVPNLVTVGIGTNGEVDFYNAFGSLDIVVDVEGYYAPNSVSPGGSLFHPESPTRIADTRAGATDPSTYAGATLGPNSTLNVNVVGANGDGVPSGASAVVLNVTVTNPTAAGYLTVYPQGVNRPTASNLNFVAGETVPNRVIVGLSPTGEISLYNAFGSLDVVVDVNGYFSSSPGGYSFNPVPPDRICDTRLTTSTNTQCIGETLSPGEIITVGATGNISGDGVPSMTSSNPPIAIVANVTVTNTSASGSYLTVWPSGGTQSGTSDLNWVPGETVPNQVIVQLGPNGDINIFNAYGEVDVIVDIVGWYS